MSVLCLLGLISCLYEEDVKSEASIQDHVDILDELEINNNVDILA